MTCDADRRSLRPPSCCSVLVMNGACGRERYGFSSTERDRGSRRPPARVAEASARGSSRTTTLAATLATSVEVLAGHDGVPSTATSSAVNDGAVAVVSSMSQ